MADNLIVLLDKDSTYADNQTAPNDLAPGPVGARTVVDDDTYGRQELVLVHNKSGADYAKGVAVIYTVSSMDLTALGNSGDTKFEIAGIARTIIPDDTYGWCVRNGRCQAVEGAASIAAGGLMRIIAATGRVDDAAPSTTPEYFGRFLAAGIGAGNLVEVQVQLP